MKRTLLPLLLIAVWLALPVTVRATGQTPGAEPPDPPPAAALRSAAAPSDTALRYTVRAGDTLWTIATYHGITVQVVSAANGLRPTSFIYAGMQLLIPWSNPVGTARYGPSGAPVVKGPGLHFVASIAQQTCWLFRAGVVVERWPCSTGRSLSPSIPGNYTVQTKMARAYGDTWDFWMPQWLGIYSAGTLENGIHGLPYDAKTGEVSWRNDIGRPITYGCVMLGDGAAQELYDLAFVGMPVTVLP